MPETPNQNRVYRFGIFELDAGTGELRKDGKSRPRLQGQPLEILIHLLNHPGAVVTRDELRQRLWPADTFVDYDHSLNTAVNKLREALNDSADNPTFIQTIPRKGYRFIATAQIVSDVSTPEKALDRVESGSAPVGQSDEYVSLLSDPRELPVMPRAIVRLLFSLIQVMYLCFYIFSLAYLHRLEDMLAQVLEHSPWLIYALFVTALIGIPIRLYLLSAALFGYRGLTRRFLTLFPVLFPLDEFWAFAPLLLANQIGIGLALAGAAALLYLPFSQRSLLLMGEGNSR